jgi:GntR family uxuAB operon transcriptional repressor
MQAYLVQIWPMKGETMERPKRKRPGSADVATLLRREITGGTLQPRDRLPPERVLAERYGVARGTVREALTRLARDGMVEIKPGSGTYVVYEGQERANSIIQHARPLELIDARFALEPHICRLAVLHAQPKDFERAEALLAEMEASVQDPARFSDADTEFHTLLAEATGNSLIIWILSEVSAVRNQEQWSHMRALTLSPEVIRNYNAQHRGIVDAIRSREPERAATLMKAHLETARLSLTRAAAT